MSDVFDPVERIRSIAAVLDGLAPGELQRARYDLTYATDVIQREFDRFSALVFELSQAISEHKNRALYEPADADRLLDRVRGWDEALWAQWKALLDADHEAGLRYQAEERDA